MNHATLQRCLAARIRDPQQASSPGITMERMTIHEELFFNDLDDFISSGFPVLHRLFGELRQHRLMRAFMREHRCHIPYFSRLGEGFIGWLQDDYHAGKSDPSFLLKLTHYEWVELALSLAEVPTEALLQAQSWSPLAWPLAYCWPVRRLGPSHRPMKLPTEPTCLPVWRDPAGRVRFLHLSPLVYCLAQHLSEEGEVPVTLLPLLCELTGNYGLNAGAEYFENAFALLEDWHAQGILMGKGVLE